MQGEALKGHLDLLLLAPWSAAGAWLCGGGDAAKTERRDVRSAGRHAVSGAASAGGLRPESRSRWTEESGAAGGACISSRLKGAARAWPGGRWQWRAFARAVDGVVEEWHEAEQQSKSTLRTCAGSEASAASFATRYMEKTRGHLTDAMKAGQRGASAQDAAEEAAIRSFGRILAEVAEEIRGAHKYLTLHWVAADRSGHARSLAIAWVDSRRALGRIRGSPPDCLRLSGGALGLIGPAAPRGCGRWGWAFGFRCI